jgi:hypothetical protein
MCETIVTNTSGYIKYCIERNAESQTAVKTKPFGNRNASNPYLV